MDWFVSQRQFFADFILVPLYIVAVILAGYPQPESSWLWLLWPAAGYLVWGLVEYMMHRWVFHVIYRREHNAHHAYPTHWIGVAPVFTFASFFVVWLATVQWAGISKGGLACAGFMMGYYHYIFVHYLIHHSDSQLVGKRRAAHEWHHRSGVEANFGISTLIWDRIFRTYWTV